MTELTIDPASGLPKLPKGYFWRVKPCYSRFCDYAVDVELRKRTWIFSHRVDDIFSTVPGIPYSAAFLVESFYSTRSRYNGVDDVIGDYPPKKWTRA